MKDELATRIASMVSSADPVIHLDGLRLAIWVTRGAVITRNRRVVVPAKAPEQLAEFWDDFADQNAKSHATEIAAASACDEGMLYASLRHRFLTAGHVLTSTGSDLTPLFTNHRAFIFDATWTSYLEFLTGAAARAWGHAIHSGLPTATEESINEDFAVVGQFLIDHPSPPWLSLCLSSRDEMTHLFMEEYTRAPGVFEATSPTTYLGVATAILIMAEMTSNRILPADGSPPLGAFSDLYPYILRRWGYEQNTQLPVLPVAEKFQRLFGAWAAQQTDFIRYSVDPDP